MSTITTINATDLITNSRTTINTNFANLNTDKFETSNVDTDTTLAANSDTKVPSQKAIKAYVDALGGQTYLVPTGAVLPYGGTAAPSNFLLCDGSPVSRSTYATLFAVVSTSFGAGNGTTTFNVPDMRGRVPVGAGTGTVTVSGVDADVDTGTDAFTIATNNTKWITGMQVVFTLSGGTITGLSSASTYYVIRASATTIKLASTLALAEAGTPIDLTAKSSPVWTITGTLTARTVGEFGGEESHAISALEIPTITPTLQDIVTTSGGATRTGLLQATSNAAYSSIAVTLTGTGNAHNIMDPFQVFNYIIKT